MTKQLIACFAFFLLFSQGKAQVTVDYDLHLPAHQSTVYIAGSSSDPVVFSWSSGKGTGQPGTSFTYDLLFDSLSGDFSTPLDYITNAAYSSYFNDTSLVLTKEIWSHFLNGISQTLRGRDFMHGDTLRLKWRANLTAIEPGPSYEFKTSSSDFAVTFIRGQLNDELTPVNLYYPPVNQLVAVDGNPNATTLFSWSASWCPDGCGTASYQLLIDTALSDFSQPPFSVLVPMNDSSWEVSYSTLNQFLVDTKTPEGATRVIWWKVLAIGNGEVLYSKEARPVVLWNGLLDNEHHAFNLINPGKNLTITLSGDANTQLNFKWESTFTNAGQPSFYTVVFDTAENSPLFGNPLFQFLSANGGSDTAINLTYGQLDHAVDSLYPGWQSVRLMWSVKALINGTYYYPEEPHEVIFNAGIIKSARVPEANRLKVYPNPTRQSLNLELEGLPDETWVTDLQGRTVKRIPVDPTHPVSLSGLKPGTYLLHVRMGDTLLTGRFILLP